MGKTLFLVSGMLITGTVNTILNKLQDMQCVENCQDPDPRKRVFFEQPLFQTLNMFIGESACLLVFFLSQWLEKRREAVQGYSPIDAGSSEDLPVLASSKNGVPLTGYKNLLLWLPTLCDMTATTLMNVGLIFVSASIYQMLRGSVVLFTGLLSFLFLGRRNPGYRWFALLTVFVGVAVVGLSGILSPSAGQGEHPSGSLIGVFMVVLAQVFTASQFVIEEKILGGYDVDPLKAVGLEGIFGLITTSSLLPIVYAIWGKSGKHGNYFDVPTGFAQFFGFNQVLFAGIGIIFSIAFFNWFGLSVTRYISATSRSTIDTCRTLFIWMISLSLGWESFKWMQVLGFMILIYGTFLFNDVIEPPFGMKKERREEELLDEDPRID